MGNCWYCETEIIWQSDAEMEKHCDNCGVLVDRNPYKPEPQPKEEVMKPEKQGGSQFNPFLKFPNPNEGTEGEIKIGDSVEILDEFAPPTNPKLKSPLFGNVKLENGDLRAMGLNWGSYYNIASSLGQDTSEWVGKKIKYEGLKKSTKGAYGHRWGA